MGQRYSRDEKLTALTGKYQSFVPVTGTFVILAKNSILFAMFKEYPSTGEAY